MEDVPVHTRIDFVVRGFALTLSLLAPIFLVVAVLHLFFGFGENILLGANVPTGVTTESSMDSQKRFLGMDFALYGVILLIGADDMRRYKPILAVTLCVEYAAGLAGWHIR